MYERLPKFTRSCDGSHLYLDEKPSTELIFSMQAKFFRCAFPFLDTCQVLIDFLNRTCQTPRKACALTSRELVQGNPDNLRLDFEFHLDFEFELLLEVQLSRTQCSKRLISDKVLGVARFIVLFCAFQMRKIADQNFEKTDHQRQSSAFISFVEVDLATQVTVFRHNCEIHVAFIDTCLWFWTFSFAQFD